LICGKDIISKQPSLSESGHAPETYKKLIRQSSSIAILMYKKHINLDKDEKMGKEKKLIESRSQCHQYLVSSIS